MLRADNTTDDEHIIEWKIENFSRCTLSEGEALECPVSTARNFFYTKWRFLTYPRRKTVSGQNFLGCTLKRETDKTGPEKIHIEFEFSVVTFDGQQRLQKGTSIEFERGDSFGFPYFVKLEEILSRREIFLHCDSLTLRCNLRLLPPQKKQPSSQTFISRFPTETISTSMILENFQEISKQCPMVFTIKRSNRKQLLMKVSMNKDETSEDRILEEAVGNKDSEFPESYLHMVMIKKKWNPRVHVSCWIKLLNSKSEIANDREFVHLFTKKKEQEEWVLPYFIDTNNLADDCIDNGKLHLECSFTICDSQPVFLEKEDFAPPKTREDPGETTLMKDLVAMYDFAKFPDVTLRVGYDTFPAHKSILAARSPKFDEIFTRLTKEPDNSENSIVEIDDVSSWIMRIMLEFIYTDKLDEIDEETCFSLYSAAQKYQISSLRFKCIRLFRGNLTLNTFYKVLVIAEEFMDSYLKAVALDYMFMHNKFILLTPEWQAFTEEHEELSNQVMEHLRRKESEKLYDDAMALRELLLDD